MNGRRSLAIAAALALAGPAAAGPPPAVSGLMKKTEAAHPTALWHVVHDLCVMDMQTLGNPAPCLAVDLQGGHAVVKDLADTTQLLLVPTRRVTGIESPLLQAPDSPNYWQAAWAARALFARQAGVRLERDEVMLAVNSVWARTQNQLHVHIECIRPDVRAALKAHADQLRARWSPFPVPLNGARFRARWVAGEDLRGADPFRLLADGERRARGHMGRMNLAVVGSRKGRAPGFILLSHMDRGPGPRAIAAESLTDHACAVLRER